MLVFLTGSWEVCYEIAKEITVWRKKTSLSEKGNIISVPLFFPPFSIVIICFQGCSCVLFDWVDDKCNNREPKFLTLGIDYDLGSQKL